MTNADLAKTTGLTDLDKIAIDPERLERAYDFAQTKIAHLDRRAPLRVKVALDEYARRAMEMLSNPPE
jgi:hypothetical protein